MIRQIKYTFVFSLMIIICIGCRTPIVFDESEIKEIILGDKILQLDAVIGKGKDKQSALKSPISMAVDTNGNIYVIDGKKRDIFLYSSSGDFIRRLDLQTESGRTFSPMFIAKAPDGSMFLMDVHLRKRWKRRIHFISRNNEVLTTKEIPSYFIEFVKCGDDLFFSTYDGRRDKLMVKVPISGSNSTEFGEMNSIESQLHYFYNQVVICSDGKENILLSNIYLPRVRIFSSDGMIIRDFKYEAGIKNQKGIFNVVMPNLPNVEGDAAFISAAFKVETYPICYDIAVNSQGSIYLLMAVDHSNSAKRALFQFGFDGKLIDRIVLPFSSHRIHVDNKGNIYFLGAAEGSYILKYKYVSI